MKFRQTGQSTVEFLVMGGLIALLMLIGVQMGTLLFKTEQIQFAAFWASRAICVNGDAERAGMKAFGQEPLARGIQIRAGAGAASVDYEVKPHRFPLVGRWLGSGDDALIVLKGGSWLVPDPGGDDGDN